MERIVVPLKFTFNAQRDILEQKITNPAEYTASLERAVLDGMFEQLIEHALIRTKQIDGSVELKLMVEIDKSKATELGLVDE